MKLKTIIKNSDSKTIAYTFTKDEARIKFPRKLEDNTYKFCQLVTNYLFQNNQQKSLRGSVFTTNENFILCLKDSNHNKHLVYTFVGNSEKLMEIKNEQ